MEKGDLIYKSEMKILKEGILTIAYDIENSNIVKLNSKEEKILEFAKEEGLALKNFIEHFACLFGEEEIVKLIKELERVNLLFVNSKPKRISKEEILNFEETFYNKIKNSPLYQILLNVTHHCNLACRYCYAGYGAYGGKAMPMKKEVAKQAVDFLLKESKESKFCRITFFGGEPLLNFNLIKFVIEYAKQEAKRFGKKVLFGMTTNGTLLNKDIIQFIIDNEIDVTLSFDGPEEIQNQNRHFKGLKKAGSYRIIFPRIKEFVKEAREKDRFFAVRTTLTRKGCTNIRKIMDFFRKLGIDRVKFAFAENEEYPENSPHMFIDDESLLIFRKEVRKASEDFLEAKLQDKEPRYGGILYGVLKEIEKKNKRFNICTTMGSKFVAVSVNGDIFPCHRFISFPETKIGDIWNGIDKKWLERMKKIHIFNSEVCSKCWLRYKCGGMCPNTNYLLAKDFVLKNGFEPVYCKGIKILFEEGMILYSKLKKARLYE